MPNRLTAAEMPYRAAVKPKHEPSIERAIYSWKDSAADFADCLIEARNRRLGCRATATFDGKALKLAGFVSV
jgi:predicted nucleic-acid-binding protein